MDDTARLQAICDDPQASQKSKSVALKMLVERLHKAEKMRATAEERRATAEQKRAKAEEKLRVADAVNIDKSRQLDALRFVNACCDSILHVLQARPEFQWKKCCMQS